MATCSKEEVHFNDIGTVILVTVNDCVNGTVLPLDVSTATDLDIILRSPSGSVYTKTAVLNTDGTDGKIKYTSVDGDFNEIGVWKVQVRIEFSVNSIFKSDIGTFRVFENL